MSGVDLGSDLLRPGPFNPEGHFEDLDFLAFHGSVLEARDPSGLALWCPPHDLGWTADERARAARLVAQRRGRGAWGWKDPRTVLFLEDWLELLPEACFVLVFRDPAQVVDSLRRRRDRQLLVRVLGSGLTFDGRRRGFFRYARAIEAWRLYNERVSCFAIAHPERCLVADLDAIVRDPAAVLATVQQRFDLPLVPVDWGDVFAPRLLRQRPHRRVCARIGRRVDVRDLHARLRKLTSLG